MKLADELVARLARLATEEGVALLAVETAGTARRPVVRLVLDCEGGVTLERCEAVSRQASVLLDAYDPFSGAFTLEVSSPGIERKFYHPEDFERFVGEDVKVRMRPTWRGRRLVEGRLAGLVNGHVRVEDLAGNLHDLPEPEVFETRLAPFLQERRNRTTRKGKGDS